MIRILSRLRHCFMGTRDCVGLGFQHHTQVGLPAPAKVFTSTVLFVLRFAARRCLAEFVPANCPATSQRTFRRAGQLFTNLFPCRNQAAICFSVSK